MPEDKKETPIVPEITPVTPVITTPVTTTTTSVTKQVTDHWFYQFIDAMSLSGAIMMMFFSLTVYGITIANEKVWMTFGTALTTFVSGKKIGQSEQIQTQTQKAPKE